MSTYEEMTKRELYEEVVKRDALILSVVDSLTLIAEREKNIQGFINLGAIKEAENSVTGTIDLLTGLRDQLASAPNTARWMGDTL